MDVKPTNSVTFGYNNQLKTFYKLGKFQGLKSFSGEPLLHPSLDHIKPKSKGGKNDIGNYVLTNCKENRIRGNKNIDYYLIKNRKGVEDYIDWFLTHTVEGFDCKGYILKVINTINRLSENFIIFFER